MSKIASILGREILDSAVTRPSRSTSHSAMAALAARHRLKARDRSKAFD